MAKAPTPKGLKGPAHRPKGTACSTPTAQLSPTGKRKTCRSQTEYPLAVAQVKEHDPSVRLLQPGIASGDDWPTRRLSQAAFGPGRVARFGESRSLFQLSRRERFAVAVNNAPLPAFADRTRSHDDQWCRPGIQAALERAKPPPTSRPPSEAQLFRMGTLRSRTRSVTRTCRPRHRRANRRSVVYAPRSTAAPAVRRQPKSPDACCLRDWG